MESAAPNGPALLARETKTLSDMGNNFHIRHWETNRSLIEQDFHDDYLFHRLYPLLHLLLKERTKTGAAIA